MAAPVFSQLLTFVSYGTPDPPPPRRSRRSRLRAKRSVESLAALEPELVLAGHGHPPRGPAMRAALHLLARDFDRTAVPAHRRYVSEPARADESGPTYVPPKNSEAAVAGARAGSSGGTFRRRDARARAR